MSTQNLPAQLNHNDPYAAYGRQAAASNHPFLSYKKGYWVKGKDTDIQMGTRVVALMSEFKLGYMKWTDNKPVENKMVTFGTEKPATRDQLGDHDKALWPTDDKGQPRDPWQFTNTIPVYDLEKNEQLLFTTSSGGGITAVGKLCTDYGARRLQYAGKCPVIELGTGSYTHPVYGRTPIPVLKIVDWVPDPTLEGDAGQGDLLTHAATGTVEEVAASTGTTATAAPAGTATRF